MIKCVFFDVDGTLLSHRTGHVPESTVRALRKLREAGIQVVMSTGRHRLELEELPVGELTFDGYVTLNGQIIYDNEWNLLQEYPIAGEAKECLIGLFERRDIPLILVERDGIYINFVNDYVRRVQKDIMSSIPREGKYHGNEIFLAVAYVDGAAGENFAERLSQLQVTRWHSQAVDITPMDGGKVRGIAYYLERNGILPEESLAFGDSENDIEMLEFAGVGVAMGNADDKVKRAANFVADDIDEDGIWKALVELGMIGE